MCTRMNLNSTEKMENEDYVPYELAKALRAAGFDWPCSHYYCAFDKETDVRFWSIHPEQSQNAYRTPKDKIVADAPTLWQAQKWLREKHHLNVNISTVGQKAWTTCINGYNEEDCPVGYLHPVNIIVFDTYEKALSAGIATALGMI